MPKGARFRLGQAERFMCSRCKLHTRSNDAAQVVLTTVHPPRILATMKTKTFQKPKAGQKLAYSYRRFSSQNQTDNTSLARQLQDAQRVCLEKGWELVDLPPDEGVSAWRITDLDEQKAANFHKGNLGKFLQKVNAGEIPKGSVLIIDEMSRFSRNYVDLVMPIFFELLHNDIQVYSCQDRTHYTLADIRKDRYMVSRLADHIAFANEYGRNLSHNIVQSVDIKLAKAQQGQKLQLGSWMPRWVDFIGKPREAGEFKLNAHAKTITRIATEYLSGRSMYQIARILIADKVATLLGGKWAQGTIKNLLSHQCLRGDMTIKGILLKGYYPSVITQPQWEKLQAKLRENINRKGGNGPTDAVANLFRNRCKCAHCGGTITTAKSASHRLYTCKTKRVGQCPSKYSIRVSEVELDFFLLYLQQGPNTLLAKNTPKHADIVAKMTAELAEHDKAIADTIKLIGLVDVIELQTKLADLNQKREVVQGIIEKVNATMLSGQNAPRALTDVKGIVSRLLKASGHTEAQATKDFLKVANNFEKVLQDNETRKQLLALLPSIVHHLIIDTTKGAYKVVSINGVESEWREVV